jgi:hypothetical protein
VNVSSLTLDQLVKVRILLRQLTKYLQNAENEGGPVKLPGLFDANLMPTGREVCQATGIIALG